MGHLIYGIAPAIEIEDWALRHLQAVMMTKLRRDESFTFSWDNEPDVDGDDTDELDEPGRYETVWVSKSIPLYFSYSHPRTRSLNKQWLTALAAAANSTGLHLIPEPE